MADSESVEPERDGDVLDAIERAMQMLEGHSDPAVRDAAQRLATGLDIIHRAGLTHLIDGIRGMAGDAFLNRLTSDPAIRLLLMSYDLIAVDRRLLAEEALDLVRGHLHDHGVDVELVDVVGGVVYARVHVRRAGQRQGDLPIEAVRRDVEAALRDAFVGFQELVFSDREAHAPAAAFVPLGQLQRANRPMYRDVLALSDLPPGTLRAVEIDGMQVLLANADGEILAVQNRCGDSPLPLEYSSFDGVAITCSWHGCRYDARTGRQLDAGDNRLQVYPVAVDEGRIRIAVGVTLAVGESR